MTSIMEFGSFISPKIVFIAKYKKAPEAKDKMWRLYESPITKPDNFMDIF